MFMHLARSLLALAPLLLVASAPSALGGCSKENDPAPVPTPAAQAQAVQASVASAQAARASIASAQAAHDHQAPGMTEDAAPSAPVPMGAPGGGVMPDAGAPAAGAAMASTAPSGDTAPMNMVAPTGMARMLGQPPMAGGSGASGGLPAAMGAPHIYHLGADTFFLDQASAIGLTSEQQKRLTALKENASIAYVTTQRKIEQGEQDLWVLSSAEVPDVVRIETKIGDIARLTGQQRMEFIRTVGKAVGVLSDAQRKAVATRANAGQPAAMAPDPSASSMGRGDGGPPSGGMGMGDPGKMPPGMPMHGGGMPRPGMGMGMGGMADAGASGGMGHM